MGRKFKLIKDLLTPGINAEEFGCVLPVEGFTFKDINTVLKKLQDDYEHQKKHCFPFYSDEPQVTMLNKPKSFVDSYGNPVSYEDTSVAHLAWYLCVPNEHVVQHSDSYLEKEKYLKGESHE